MVENTPAGYSPHFPPEGLVDRSEDGAWRAGHDESVTGLLVLGGVAHEADEPRGAVGAGVPGACEAASGG
jgi:hypothetical protein